MGDSFGYSSNEQTSSSTLVATRHPKFYFTEVIFLVEDQLFKVPRRNFAMESELFADMFQLPVPNEGDGASPDGCSDDQPIRLEGIKKYDFVQLLRVMFSSKPNESDSLNPEEWTSVLKLSTMWQLNRIRAIAIKNMEDLLRGPIDRIVIARKFDVTSWFVPALNALVQRERPLDPSEGHRLGMEWTLKVAELREREVPGYSCFHTCSTCGYIGPSRCDSCTSTSHNRCGSCFANHPTVNQEPQHSRGSKSNVDYSDQIRKVFGLL